MDQYKLFQDDLEFYCGLKLHLTSHGGIIHSWEETCLVTDEGLYATKDIAITLDGNGSQPTHVSIDLNGEEFKKRVLFHYTTDLSRYLVSFKRCEEIIPIKNARLLIEDHSANYPDKIHMLRPR